MSDADAEKIASDDVIKILGLVPLPDEGGLWTQILIDDHSTAIYYLLTADDFSAMHRLPGPEIYHHYLGAPTQLVLMHPDNRVERPILGPNLHAGERPSIVVPGGVWQGCRSLGDWSLMGTTMAPPFDLAQFELADRGRLTARYPTVSSLIAAHTR